MVKRYWLGQKVCLGFSVAAYGGIGTSYGEELEEGVQNVQTFRYKKISTRDVMYNITTRVTLLYDTCESC